MRHDSWNLALSSTVLALFAIGGCQTTTTKTSLLATEASAVAAPGDRERDLYISVIGQLIDHGKFYAALAHLDEFQRVHGPTEPSRRLRGDAWLAIGALANAEQEYAAVAAGKLAGYGNHGLGRVAASRRDWPLASRYFALALNDQPTNTRFLQDYASVLFELGKVDEAEFQRRKALELSPPDTEATVVSQTLVQAGTTEASP